MKLKEMEGVGIPIKTDQELDEFISMCKASGWNTRELNTGFSAYKDIGFYVDANSDTMYGKVNVSGKNMHLITLEQFKKEQGIMKYKAGDVLVGRNNEEIKVLAICGSVYFTSDEDDFDTVGSMFLEEELCRQGFKIAKDDPELTEVTLEQVAEKMGVPVDQLRIKD